MNPPKVAAVLLLAVIALTLLNFLLKYYMYLVLVVAAQSDDSEETAVPHPRELYVPFLTFVPGISPVLSRPWVLITAAFVQTLILLLVPTLLVIFYVGGYLEARWGVNEFLRFVVVVGVTSNVILYAYYSLMAWVSNSEVVVESPTAIVVALLVAAKQRFAQHYVLLLNGVIRIKVTYVPFLVLVGVGILRMFNSLYAITWLLSVLGFGISWTYLRYLQPPASERNSHLLPFARGDSPFDSNSVRGDRSDLFALSTFFPGLLEVLMHRVGTHTFLGMVRRKLVDPAVYTASSELQDVVPVQSRLFGLSALKGAGDVAPLLVGALRGLVGWGAGPVDIKDSMDKRRKLAIRELE